METAQLLWTPLIIVFEWDFSTFFEGDKHGRFFLIIMFQFLPKGGALYCLSIHFAELHERKQRKRRSCSKMGFSLLNWGKKEKKQPKTLSKERWKRKKKMGFENFVFEKESICHNDRIVVRYGEKVSVVVNILNQQLQKIIRILTFLLLFRNKKTPKIYVHKHRLSYILYKLHIWNNFFK